MSPLLEVERLALECRAPEGWRTLVDDVSFAVDAGESVGLVGESGSGKSLTAFAVLGLLPVGIRRRDGEVRFDGRDPSTLPRRELQRLRGSEISAIFQDPMNSLNPAYSVGNQLVEAISTKDRTVDRAAARTRAGDLLERVGIANPGARLRLYPHELSGGMAQRVMIAMAIANRPRLLVADEPTTALDVTVQRQILELLGSLRAETGMSLLLISHDLAVVSQVADRVAVVYAGQTVEVDQVSRALNAPRHPYTEALLAARPALAVKGQPLRTIPGMVPSPAAMPTGCRFAGRCSHVVSACEEPQVWVPLGDRGHGVRCGRHADLGLIGLRVLDIPVANPAPRSPSSTPLLRVTGLTKIYPPARSRGEAFTAVDDVSFELAEGETLGLVGESGAGKSTVGRMILGLTELSAGTIEFDGAPLPPGPKRSLALRSDIQVVFQNPYATLDPTMRIEDSVAEPLDALERTERKARRAKVLELLGQVGLDPAVADRRPHELSGGQRQRVAIARALAPSPRLIVCDEPVSALDVSTQAQVINLLQRLQEEQGVAYLFVGHDLSVVYHVSTRVAVMRDGRIVEDGSAEAVWGEPSDPYTRELLAAQPELTTT